MASTAASWMMWGAEWVDSGSSTSTVRSVFLAGVAAVFFVAFQSLAGQVPALLGLLPPSATVLRTVPAGLPSPDAPALARAAWAVRAWANSSPHLLWLFKAFPGLASHVSLLSSLQLHTGLGRALSGWAALYWAAASAGLASGSSWLGSLTALAFAGLTVLYLSLTTVFATLTLFQWDVLLVEVGWFAAVYALAPSRLLSWYGSLIAFKLMFSSGIVKFSSGCPTWRNLTAMDYHHTTQPLPHLGGYYAAMAPHAFHAAAVVGNHVIEAALPLVFLVGGAWAPVGLAGAAAYIALQIGVMASGNYGFFNVLTAILCVNLLRDDMVGLGTAAATSASVSSDENVSLLHAGLRVTAVALRLMLVVGGAALCAMHVRDAFRDYDPLDKLDPEWRVSQALFAGFDAVYDVYSRWWVGQVRASSGYGLFARMTTDRPEVHILGSNDGGATWTLYEFKYKPGSIDRAPVYAYLHMPRVDWRMWFLFPNRSSRVPWWFQSLCASILTGNAEVVQEVFVDPPADPPSLLRAVWTFYEYDHSESPYFWKLRKRGATTATVYDPDSHGTFIEFLLEHSEVYAEYERRRD